MDETLIPYTPVIPRPGGGVASRASQTGEGVEQSETLACPTGVSSALDDRQSGEAYCPRAAATSNERTT